MDNFCAGQLEHTGVAGALITKKSTKSLRFPSKQKKYIIYGEENSTIIMILSISFANLANTNEINFFSFPLQLHFSLPKYYYVAFKMTSCYFESCVMERKFSFNSIEFLISSFWEGKLFSDSRNLKMFMLLSKFHFIQEIF